MIASVDRLANQILFAVAAGAVENVMLTSSTFFSCDEFMERSVAKPAVILCALLVVAPCEGIAQRSHGSSHASSGRTGGGFGGMSGGQRWGTPAASGYDSQKHASSSAPWTLRPPHSSYSGLYYSRGLVRPLVYGDYRGPVQYHNQGHQDCRYYTNGANSYSRRPNQNGLSIQYSAGYRVGNGFVYGPGYGLGVTGIVAPPIGVPYGDYLPNPVSATLPSTVQLVASPPPGEIATQFPSGNVATGREPQGAASDMSLNGELLSQRLPADETPVVNEFGNDFKMIPAVEVSAVNRIRSLRYQTSGDSAFRQQDYVSAEVFYKAAAESGVVRRAPWLRLAWVHVARQMHVEAVNSLKTALHLQDDPTSSWISGADLFGSEFESNSIAQDEDLWMWLQARPNSTDRLLLVAAFQQLRGYPGVARELLDAASRNGLDRTVVMALREISEVQNPPDDDRRLSGEDVAPPQRRALIPVNPLSPANPLTDDGGIRLRGRDVVPAPHVAEHGVGQPEPLLSEEDLPAVNSEFDSPPVSIGPSLTIPPVKAPSP